MKRLLLILILTFSFQTLSKADDIRDFEIEGMSIGDSLLNYFTEEEINNATDNSYDATKFITRSFLLKKSKALSPMLMPSISKSLMSSALDNV